MRARFAELPSGRAGVCAALAALVFCSRAWLVNAWGSPVPFWDQWDMEGALYHAWFTHTLRWRDLFAAHNEHRIALTRFADLALLVACGNWNPWAQLLLNAALHAATAGALAAMFWTALPPPFRAAFVAGLAVLFTALCGWQNALWGFQSQVYFLDLLVVGAIAGLVSAAPLGRRWWLGWCAAGLALVADAGGVLAAVAALGTAVFLSRQELRRPRVWIALAAVAAVVALGLALRVAPPQHELLRARSVGQFLAVMAHCLSWPHIDSGWVWPIMQLPLVALCFGRWRRRVDLAAPERCALALGLFAVLHSAAVAYSRGAGLPELRPLSRYQDPLLLGVAAQLFAALRLAATSGRAGRLLLLGWTAVALAGLLQLTTTNLTLHLPFKRAQDRASLAQIRAYLGNGNAAVFAGNDAFTGPHPDPAVVPRVLDDPVLRPVLPAAFRRDDTAPWLVVHGAALTFAAAAALIIALAFFLRATSRGPHLARAAPLGAGQRDALP